MQLTPDNFNNHYSPIGNRSYLEEFFPGLTIFVLTDTTLSQSIHLHNIESIIAQIPKLDLVVIDVTDNPYPFGVDRSKLDVTINIASKYAKTLVLIDDFSFYKSNDSTVIYFPLWLWMFSKRLWLFWKDTPMQSFMEPLLISDIVSNKSKGICCLNRSTHRHRVVLFNQLVKYELLDKIHYTFGVVPFHNPPELTQNELDEYFGNQHLLPRIIVPGDLVNRADPGISHLVYAECAFNLTVESTADHRGMITEKTCKPFMALQIPIIFGPRGISRQCALYGLDMFNDIIPWHTWDDIDDCQEKAHIIVKFLCDFVEQDLLAIYNKNIERVNRNKEYFHSEKFRSIILQDMHTKL